jgi:hypothetical protein
MDQSQGWNESLIGVIYHCEFEGSPHWACVRRTHGKDGKMAYLELDGLNNLPTFLETQEAAVTHMRSKQSRVRARVKNPTFIILCTKATIQDLGTVPGKDLTLTLTLTLPVTLTLTLTLTPTLTLTAEATNLEPVFSQA